jgi:hypothetical protein
MARAEDYVFGLMDENERRRAERDMEIDAEFRQCVLELAQKLQRLHDGHEPPRSPDEIWGDIAARIAELPQMAGMAAARIGAADPLPGKRRIQPGRRPVGRGLHAHDTGRIGSRGVVMALGLIIVFGLGYLAAMLR